MNEALPVLEINVGSFSYGTKDVLQNIHVSLQQGERVALLGPSGSGKTSLLKIVAQLKGFKPQSGTLVKRGEFSFIFQDNVLLDHLNVEENIGLPAKLQGVPCNAKELAQFFRVSHLLKELPRRISGGEKKRVAMARGFAYPNLAGILMDEPFVALDFALRERILHDLKNRLEMYNLSCLFSTHAVEEAIFLARKIVIIGNSPGTVIRVFQVPRTSSDLSVFSADHIELATEIIRCLRNIG